MSVEEVVRLCKKLYVLIGIKDSNVPNGEDAELIFNTMRSVFGIWTANEIIYAVTLALQNKLENVNLDLYDRPFNLNYISKILKEYKKLKSQILVRYNQDNQVEQKPSEEEILKTRKNNANKCFERYRDKGQILDFNNMTYKFLKDRMNYSEELKNKIREETIKQYEKQLLLGLHDKEENNGRALNDRQIREIINKEINIAKKCRGFDKGTLNRIYCDNCLKHYFDKLISDNKEIKTH